MENKLINITYNEARKITGGAWPNAGDWALKEFLDFIEGFKDGLENGIF